MGQLCRTGNTNNWGYIYDELHKHRKIIHYWRIGDRMKYNIVQGGLQRKCYKKEHNGLCNFRLKKTSQRKWNLN